MTAHFVHEPQGSRESYGSRVLALAHLWNTARQAAKYEDSMFIWIPKNAGTSVYTMLHRSGLVKLNTPRTLRLFRNSGRVTFGHMSTASLVESGVLSRDYVDRAFKFAVTRDPYARAVSLYRMFSKKMVNWHHHPSFREFLQMIADGYYDRIGFYNNRVFSACNPQVEWLRDAWPDKLYRMENLDEFAGDISDRWGIAQPDVAHANPATRNHEVELDREENRLIERIYAEDFKTFGYSER